MKGLAATVASSLLLCVIAGQAAADDAYLGSLDGSQPITVNVDNGTSVGPTLVVFQYFGESQRATDDGVLGDSMKFEYFRFAGGERRALTAHLPRKTRLFFVQVNNTPPGPVSIEVVQGSAAYQRFFDGSGNVALDIHWP
jgi:hypothetical protein